MFFKAVLCVHRARTKRVYALRALDQAAILELARRVRLEVCEKLGVSVEIGIAYKTSTPLRVASRRVICAVLFKICGSVVLEQAARTFEHRVVAKVRRGVFSVQRKLPRGVECLLAAFS
jgi:hypothetical protein